MKKVRLFLNVADKYTGVIFDKDSKLRLTLNHPYGEVNEITEGIRRSISAGRIIDIDNVSKIEVPDRVKAIHNKILKMANINRNFNKKPVEDESVVAVADEGNINDEASEVKEEKVTKKSTKKKGGDK